MNLFINKAIKQLFDSVDKAAVLDMMATRVAKYSAQGKSQSYIVEAITTVLRSYGFSTSQISSFVTEHLSDDYTKYDGYGPDGFSEDTGYLHVAVSYSKTSDEKITRSISIGFDTTIGQAQDFDIPKKVTVTEI